jgi:hypothetical protein
MVLLLHVASLKNQDVRASTGLRRVSEKHVTREPKKINGPCRCVMTSPASLMGAAML